ncbi:hypothetical protein MMC14_010586 [Varicellaria rhodocarpa]|nr:hypothetical protein [Varicellaria rhodocarpa]
MDRSGSPESRSQAQMKVRKRAETRATLNDLYQETITKTTEPPRVERRLESYTYERDKIALEYADTTLPHPTRKMSPLGEREAFLNKEACLDFLSMEGKASPSVEVYEVQQTICSFKERNMKFK